MAETVYLKLEEQGQGAVLDDNGQRANGHNLSAAPRTKFDSLLSTQSSTFLTPPETSMDDNIKPDNEVKLEDTAPSLTPTLVADTTQQNLKVSRSPSPPASLTIGSSSKSSTPPVTALTKSTKKSAPAPIQLISDLPIAREEALSTFHEMTDNNYQYKTLGRSREISESMTCDCTYEHGVDSEDDACGPYSDCINRLTQVECLEGDCRCRSYCQNQRFQKKQYANIEIVLTEKKGYGLRAESAISKDTFIYEYVGDVVNPISFKKRMREYAEEGIQHFYFMMLQKDEFIDATKSGGIGRFANHSCNPNCYVAKWTVENHVRMGIFAKRNIQQFEELTFNYNVDRYGHQAQECFCGEPMCVGYIGGKTQTDIATMDDLYLDALGITDEDDLIELKGTKKKKGKKIDDPDFMPTMKAVTEKDVPKVVQAIRQTTSRKVLLKLLTRIRITDDQAALRQIMRLRGYSLMTNVLDDYAIDVELITVALQCMETWPLLNKNKVQDSKVQVPVEACLSLEDETIKTLAKKLLDHWETLPVYNRIPKRTFNNSEAFSMPSVDHLIVSVPPPIRPATGPVKRFRPIEPPPSSIPFLVRPPSPRIRAKMEKMEEADRLRKAMVEEQSRKIKAMKDDSIKAIIASAVEKTAAEEAAQAAAAAEAKAKVDAAAEKAARRKERAQKKSQTPEDKEKNKEKRLMKLVGAVVVKCMSKYAKSFDKDLFKKHAKELTQKIVEREKLSSSYKEGKLDALSEQKTEKIKKFSKEHIHKTIRKIEKAGKAAASSSNSTTRDTPSTSMQTPNSNDGETNAQLNSVSVEEAMEINFDSGSEDEDDEMDGDHDVDESPMQPQTPPKDRLGWPSNSESDVNMDMGDDSHSISTAVDPRRRPPIAV